MRESTEEPSIEPFIELLTESQPPCTDNLNTTNYQYKLCVDNNFDDWLSVDTFMYKYCQERDFGETYEVRKGSDIY
ncbi:hypothetical protein C1646_765225 [Rhizophagus diaphanus]|nr:hypothetical protein C1646_765225 [Rhizophagus diaphanus] [Rhizophagus sp. MUCL 43196]